MTKFVTQMVLLAGVAIWAAVLVLPDSKLHIVFCNVGQGDATLVTYKSWQMLVDSGPNKEVLRCLARHMPFYDRRIEAVVLTHANSDHSGGMTEVAKRYEVTYWEPKLRQGQILTLGPVRYVVEWPETQVLGAGTIAAENDQGIVGRVEYGRFTALLTADVSTSNYPAEPGLDVLKVPHHGSKTEMTRPWVEATRPKLAVISVGKNSFGHPAAEIVKWLGDAGAKILRTDQMGDIEVVSDGNRWWVK